VAGQEAPDSIGCRAWTDWNGKHPSADNGMNRVDFDEIAHTMHAAIVLDLRFQDLGPSFHMAPPDMTSMVKALPAVN
jgi:hypothetical protein